MSGPYCKTCGHYRPMPLGDAHGECGDPTKIIYVGKGDRVNSEPEVRPEWECSNHTGLTKITNKPFEQINCSTNRYTLNSTKGAMKWNLHQRT